MVLDHESDALNNVPYKIKQAIQTIDNNLNYSAIMCNRAIPYFLNTLKKIHLNYYLFDEFSTTLINHKSAAFEYIFRSFTKPYPNNISQPVLLKE